MPAAITAAKTVDHAELIRRLVDAAPPLPAEQRETLRALIQQGRTERGSA